MELNEKIIKLEIANITSLLGSNDKYLQLIEQKFETLITVRGDEIKLRGAPDEVKKIESIFNELIYILKRNGNLTSQDVNTVISLMSEVTPKGADIPQKQTTPGSLILHGLKGPITARNQRQLEYYQKVLNNDLVFAIGPAGTGKTFLAVAMAVAAFKRNEISKIILSRPAVEAGESLGFLPGDLREKLDPYLRPLTDALFMMINPDKLHSMMEKNIIEITPLAYMRGRTLNDAFIILDEAQNATITQMKMFLTRLGANSRAIVTGDITQIDLQEKKNSGLINAKKVLREIKGIEFVYFKNKDVVRHKLVADIVKAYEKDSKQKETK